MLRAVVRDPQREKKQPDTRLCEESLNAARYNPG
jgi:hypothetical protein